MKVNLGSIENLTENIWHEFTLKHSERLLSIMVLKQPYNISAFHNSCPHQGRRLDYVQGEFLLDANGEIVCPAHGAIFDPTSGECLNGPCKGQSLTPVDIEIDNNEIIATFKE